MVIEIWSDVVCPFCYIGKRKLEKALSLFEHKDDIELVWRSYQLHPEVKTQPDKTIYEYLAERNGISVGQIKEEYSFIYDMAAEVGLKYKLETAVLVNTRNAHRLLHIAKKVGKDSLAEELLFKAYFTENKNIDDRFILESIAYELGIDKAEFNTLLLSKEFDNEIDNDIYQSKQIGVRGVPFFLMNNEVSVSGAQDVQVFINALQKSWEKWRIATH